MPHVLSYRYFFCLLIESTLDLLPELHTKDDHLLDLNVSNRLSIKKYMDSQVKQQSSCEN